MISRLKIEAFKSLEYVDVQLSPLTILTGVNSCGKSSLAQSLCLLRQSGRTLAEIADGGLVLNGDLVSLGAAKDVLCEYALDNRITFTVQDSGVTCAFEFNAADELDILPCASIGSPSAEVGWLERPFQFLSADRLAPAVLYPASTRKVKIDRTLGSRGEFSVHYLAINQDNQVDKRGPEGVSGKLLDIVNLWLSRISPGASVEPSHLPSADSTQMAFRYDGTAGLSASNPYRPTNVGFGMTSALPVILACLDATPGSCLIIENPEIHLHPSAQSALGELIARSVASGVQVLVETHSDHVLNGIRLSVKRSVVPADNVGVFFFSRDEAARNTKIFSPRVLADGGLSDWPKGFFDQIEHDLGALLDI